jgi:hypothetical protein
MPDHLHLFAWPGILHADFDAWVRYWKSQFSNAIDNQSRRWQETVFTIGFDLARAASPNAFICLIIRSEPVWSSDRRIGLIKERYLRTNRGGE